MASVNLGKVGLLLRGDWDSDTDYAALDVVSHEGYSYAARVANKNVEPSAETAAYWQPLAESALVLATMLGYKNDAADSATAAAGSATAAATSASSATDALANEAADFSSSKAYAIGDYVIYNNGTHKYLYRFTAAHSAGAWVGTDAVQVALADDVSDLKSALNTSAVMRRAPSLTSSDDVDTITTPGVYLAVSAQNLPETGTFVLMHFRTTQTVSGTTHWDAQIAIKEADTSKMWKRFGYNGTWKNWNVVPSTIADFGTGFITRNSLANNFVGNTNVQSTGDFNSALNDGVYFAISGASNAPTTANYYLLTFGSKHGTTQTYIQIAFAVDSNKVFYRSKYGSYAFTSWREIVYSKDTIIASFSRTPIAATGDCNDAINPGNYLVYSGAAHAPLDNKVFTMSVTKYYMTDSPVAGATYWLLQEATTADGDIRTFVRKMYNGGSFGAWAELANTDLVKTFPGKKIACFGDSITEFGDYPERFAEKTGAITYKCGFAGCRMSTYGSSNTYSTMCMSYLSDYIAGDDFTDLIAGAQDVYERTGDDNRAQAQLVSEINYSDVDYMIIFFGTNDYGGNIPIGQDSDESHDTFKGSINLVVKNLLTAYPAMRLIFVTPYWRATFPGTSDFCDSDTYTNTQNLTLPDYVDALVERAEALHIPVLNLYDSMCIGKYNYTEWLADGLHPKTGSGYEYVTQKIVAGLERFYHK